VYPRGEAADYDELHDLFSQTVNCTYSEEDCDDSDLNVNPGVAEGPIADPTCSDRLDKDCDRFPDREDPPGLRSTLQLPAQAEASVYGSGSAVVLVGTHGKKVAQAWVGAVWGSTG